MEDTAIIERYWQREESAIAESKSKYGAYCYTVAHNILEDHQDSEECVNDTWLHSWNAMPPQKPSRLGAFFAKITRNLAINRFRKRTAQKRGGGAAQVALDELETCIAAPSDTEHEYSKRVLEADINRFLHTLSRRDCDIFLLRYFYVESTAKIAKRHEMLESNVLVILSRTRKKLKEFLTKEGYFI